MQKNLFGVNQHQVSPKKTSPEKPKSTFPEVTLVKGLNRQEATADSVFWHRILINKSIRQQKPGQFLKLLGNEISLKKGLKDSYLAIQDSLKHGG